MAGSYCSEKYNFAISLMLSVAAPLVGLLLFYSFSVPSKAQFGKRVTLFAGASFIMFVGFNFLVGQLCPLDFEEIGLAEKMGALFEVIGFVFTFTLCLVWIFASRFLGKKKLKTVGLGLLGLGVLTIIVAFGNTFAGWMEPHKRTLRAAVAAEKGGECAKAIDLYKSLLIDGNEHVAETYAYWARVLISCPDQDKRNPNEAKSLIEKAAIAGPFDAEIADIAACVFAANKDFERAINVANDNKLEQRLNLFADQKKCF